MVYLSGRHIREILIKTSEEIKENRDYLIELDQAIGDGDLGLTMVEGFTKIVENLTEADVTPGDIILNAGLTMSKAVPSTMGTLLASAFISAGKSIKDKNELFLEDILTAGNAGVEGIIKRGKAKLGEKTILDSLIPAIKALEEGSKTENTIPILFEKAYQEAKKGMEATRNMQSVHGRAAWYEEKSVGKQDPGATLGMLLVKSIRDYLNNPI